MAKNQLILLTLSLFLCAQSWAIELKDLPLKSVAPTQLTLKSGNKVVVFLGTNCGCTHSHLSHLQELSTGNPDVQFLGIFSNKGENFEFVESLAKEKKISFPLVRDDEQKWADRLKAVKSPQTFVFDDSGEIIYQGGVTDSTDITRAKRFYLKEALDDLAAGRKPKVTLTKTIGCFIAR